ncbi:MAG TPA: hypothetical protein ENF43_00385, partial [Thermoplasmatales archaeon]|nr:hypothetical protein [Thermoplasmatales archaeon]
MGGMHRKQSVKGIHFRIERNRLQKDETGSSKILIALSLIVIILSIFAPILFAEQSTDFVNRNSTSNQNPMKFSSTTIQCYDVQSTVGNASIDTQSSNTSGNDSVDRSIDVGNVATPSAESVVEEENIANYSNKINNSTMTLPLVDSNITYNNSCRENEDLNDSFSDNNTASEADENPKRVVENTHTPVISVDIKAWNGTAWIDNLNVSVGETIRFNITIANTDSSCYTLYDIFVCGNLPRMLYYDDNSTVNSKPRKPDNIDNGSIIWAIPSVECIVPPREKIFVEFDAKAGEIGKGAVTINVTGSYCDQNMSCVHGNDTLEISIQPPPKYIEITPQEAYAIINSTDNDSILLLDVRSKGEYYSGHIQRAISLPLSELSESADQLKDVDRNTTIIVYSRGGYLGEKACEILANISFEHIYNIKGGLLEWIEQGLPVTQPRYPDPIHNKVYNSLMNNTPVLILFYHTKYYDHCIKQIKIVDKLKQKYGQNITFIYVNGENNDTLVKRFDVRVYPTIYVVVDYNDLGFLYTDFCGFTKKKTLENILDFVIKSDNYFVGEYKWRRGLLIHYHPPIVSVDAGKHIIHRGKARVIIRFRDSMEDDFANYTKRLKEKGFTVIREFPDKKMVAGMMNYSVFKWLKKDYDIEEILLDHRFTVFFNESLPLIRFDEVEENFSLTGKGIRICILDTGIDDSKVNYSYGYDFVEDDNIPDDDYGHGTMVASIIKKIAPDAELVVAKVIGENGIGYESDVLAGLEYCIQQNPDIILFSIGTQATS